MYTNKVSTRAARKASKEVAAKAISILEGFTDPIVAAKLPDFRSAIFWAMYTWACDEDGHLLRDDQIQSFAILWMILDDIEEWTKQHEKAMQMEYDAA